MDSSIDGVAVCFTNLFGGLGKCSIGLRYVGKFSGLLWLGTRGCPENVLLKRVMCSLVLWYHMPWASMV